MLEMAIRDGLFTLLVDLDLLFFVKFVMFIILGFFYGIAFDYLDFLEFFEYLETRDWADLFDFKEFLPALLVDFTSSFINIYV